VGERWLEAWYMIKLMIDSNHDFRPEAAKLKKYVFFMTEPDKFNLIKKAQEILMKSFSQ
jgi:hypothetical protein